MLVIDSLLMLSAWLARAVKCRQRLNLKLEFTVFLSSFHYVQNAGGELMEGFEGFLVGLGLVLGPVVRLFFGFVIGGSF